MNEAARRVRLGLDLLADKPGSAPNWGAQRIQHEMAERPELDALCCMTAGALEMMLENNPNVTDAEILAEINAVLVDDCGYKPFASIEDLRWAVDHYNASEAHRRARSPH